MLLKKKYTEDQPLFGVDMLLVFILVVIGFFYVTHRIDWIPEKAPPLLVATLLFFYLIALVISAVRRHRFFKKYDSTIETYASANLYKYNDISEGAFVVSPTLLEIGERDRKVKNVIGRDGWKVATYEYAIYRRGRYGENKVKTVYYTVLKIDLPRRMPHFLFDSKKSRKQQFKVLFDNTQRQQLEANFEKYFTSYFPKYYEIDGRSIIGPEVIEALLEAKDYDVEITGNNLYLFSPLLLPEEIEHLIIKGQDVFKSIEDEMRVYKDDRLEGLYDRDDVSVFGAHLRRNPYKQLPALLFGLIVAALSAFVFKMPVYTIAGLLASSLAGGKIYKNLKENKRLDKAHEVL